MRLVTKDCLLQLSQAATLLSIDRVFEIQVLIERLEKSRRRRFLRDGFLSKNLKDLCD